MAISPEQMREFVGMIAQGVAIRICDGRTSPDVAAVIAQTAADMVMKAPVKQFEVKRAAPNVPGGFVVQRVTLPEAITELSDLMKVSIEAQREIIVALKENTKVCRRILRRGDEDE